MSPIGGSTRIGRERRFRIAAAAYLVYGMLYLLGALYLASRGLGIRGAQGTRGVLPWFVAGATATIVFPWLISRGSRGRGYLWFTRLLTALVALRAWQVALVAVSPAVPAVPLPWGGELPMALGAWAFFGLTFVTLVLLSWAAWGRSETS